VLRLGYDNETIRLHNRMSEDNIYIGIVDTVDTEKFTMKVIVPREPDEKPEAYTVPIHNVMTNYGAGFKIMPLSGRTVINLRENYGGDYEHTGYTLDEIASITDSRSGEKQDSSTRLLHRNLNEGDVQVSGTFGSEVYLPADGSILLKSQLGAFLKLDNSFSRLEGSFANLKYETDGVRIRAGNTIRPTKTDTTEDQYILIDGDGNTKGQDEITETDTYEVIKEFTVQVGTIAGTNYVDDPDLSPSVGSFSITDRLIDEQGDAVLSAAKNIECRLKMRSGGGFSITEDGAFYIDDFVNYSPIKFNNSAENAERSLRVRKSFISISTTNDDDADYSTEIKLRHESNSEIVLDNNGNVRLQDKTGRYFEINDYGVTMNMSEAMIYLLAKDISLISDGGDVCIGSGIAPTEVILKGRLLASYYDVHVHAGPSGPPLVLWTPLIDASLAAPGIKIFLS